MPREKWQPPNSPDFPGADVHPPRWRDDSAGGTQWFREEHGGCPAAESVPAHQRAAAAGWGAHLQLRAPLPAQPGGWGVRGGEGRRGLAPRAWAIHRKKLQGSILRGAARRNRGSRRRICTLPSAPVPCAQVALVGQEPVLFSGSVRDNIAYGLRSCEDDKVIAAARAAHAYDFISEMKHGLYTGIFTLSVNRGSGTYSWGEGCVPVTHLLLPRPPSVPTHCSSPVWAPHTEHASASLSCLFPCLGAKWK